MGKDIKEKYERVCAIKDKALSLVETQLNGDLSSVDAKELGEVVDIAKDMAELMKYSEEACYYHKVTEAMDEASPEEKSFQLNKYIPEYEGKFYTPIEYARRRDARGRYMYTEPMWHDDRYDDESFRNRMYYSSMGSNNGSRMNYTGDDVHHVYDGKAYVSRRGYMEAADKGDHSKKSQELEKYMHDLTDDINEMIEDLDANERAVVKQKIAQLASKI